MSMLLAGMLWSSITARGVINPIVVAAPAGGSSALYFVLRNSSSNEDRLLSVTCDCARRVEMHSNGIVPSLTMPGDRLVELRPGGGRYLLLVGLRRPLVAGETVEMHFHYASGMDRRDVRVVAEPRTGWAASLAATERSRLAPLAPLAGWCWRGTSPGGRPAGARCFSPAYGMFMQDMQAAIGQGAPHITYTMYSLDVMARLTHYEYRGPDGVRRYGRVVPVEAGIIFEDYPQQSESGQRREMLVRTRWQRDGADAWLVVGEGRRSAGWRELWRLRMVRAGPSPLL